MEDFKFLFYIILAILYFIITNYKKFKKRAEEAEKQNHQPETPDASLEDILKQHLPKPSEPEPARSKKNKLAEERYLQRQQSEFKVLSMEKKAEAAEARRRAALLGKQQQQMKEDVAVRPVHPIAAQLRNPATARNAIILSEVLKRKEY